MRFKVGLFLLVVLLSMVSVYGQTENVGRSVTKDSKRSVTTCADIPPVIPASVAKNETAFREYMTLLALPKGSRPGAYKHLSTASQISFVRFEIAMGIVMAPRITTLEIADLVDAINLAPEMIVPDHDGAASQFLNVSFQPSTMAAKAIVQSIIADIGSNKSGRLELLRNYDRILSIGNQERIEVVSHLPIPEMANFWKTQLAYHMATGKLNEIQRQYIGSLIVDAPRILIDSKQLSKTQTSAMANKLQAEVLKRFSKEEMIFIFFRVGAQRMVKDSASFLSRNEGQYCWCTDANVCPSGTGACRLLSYSCIENQSCGVMGTDYCTHPCGNTQ